MISRERSGYEALIEAAISRESDIIGDEAIERASAVDGLDVDHDGTVTALNRDGKAVLGDLVDSYVAASGDIAAFLIGRRIENVPHDDLELPTNLATHV